jgi:hypothetical protein
MLDKLLKLQADLREIMESDNTSDSFPTADDVVLSACSDIENACTEFADCIIKTLQSITRVPCNNGLEEARAMRADDLVKDFIRDAMPQLERSGGRACATCYHGNMFYASVSCVRTGCTRHQCHCDLCEHWESRCENGYRKPAVTV